VVRALSAAGLRCRSALATGGQADRDARAKSFRTQQQQLAAGLDLLVAAPGRLLAHINAGNLKLDQTQVVVLDEVDVLCGEWCQYLYRNRSTLIPKTKPKYQKSSRRVCNFSIFSGTRRNGH
jgi:superfamily II DNA/RNA helicase